MQNIPALLMFSKYPQPGRCKTRLVPALGAEGAARLASAFLRDLAARLAQAHCGAQRLFLFFDPPDALAQFQALLQQPAGILRHFALCPQSPGNLGERLAAAAETVRAEGCGPLALIGSDAPDLPLDAIRTGFQHAAGGRAYLLPAQDGGYVLLALPRSASPAVFEQIDWSTARTCGQQAERLESLGVPTIVSETNGWDVDEPGDLAPLKERLARDPASAPLTHALLQEIVP